MVIINIHIYVVALVLHVVVHYVEMLLYDQNNLSPAFTVVGLSGDGHVNKSAQDELTSEIGISLGLLFNN